MSKSGQAHAAMMYGSQFTLYAVMRAMGIPLSEEQEKFQVYLEGRYPSVIDDTPDPARNIIIAEENDADCVEEIMEERPFVERLLDAIMCCVENFEPTEPDSLGHVFCLLNCHGCDDKNFCLRVKRVVEEELRRNIVIDEIVIDEEEL